MRQLSLVRSLPAPQEERIASGDKIKTSRGEYLVRKVDENTEGQVYSCIDLTTQKDAVILAREVTEHEPAREETREAFELVMSKIED